jgi:hypothetical protein
MVTTTESVVDSPDHPVNVTVAVPPETAVIVKLSEPGPAATVATPVFDDKAVKAPEYPPSESVTVCDEPAPTSDTEVIAAPEPFDTCGGDSVTVTCNVAVFDPVKLIVAVPPETAVMVNAFVPEAAATVATPVFDDEAVNVPGYPASESVTVCDVPAPTSDIEVIAAPELFDTCGADSVTVTSSVAVNVPVKLIVVVPTETAVMLNSFVPEAAATVAMPAFDDETANFPVYPASESVTVCDVPAPTSDNEVIVTPEPVVICGCAGDAASGLLAPPPHAAGMNARVIRANARAYVTVLGPVEEY